AGAYYTGVYDPHLISVSHKLYDAEGIFLDVGANIGFYTIAIGTHIKKINRTGKVYAFEPFAANHKRLQENIRLNNLHGVCLTNEIALSDKAGEECIVLRDDFLNGASTGNASIAINGSFDHGFKRETVQIDTLDNLWSEISGSRISFIKLDIEGHEDFFLKGASETLSKNRPIILMEVNKPFYVARNISPDAALLTNIPDKYYVYMYSKNGWIKINSLSECKMLDNVLLIPEEKKQIMEKL
ncbi:MAG: FkbM family methyltransferase, partial [Fibrobacteres bacterium]|nr:FkbM family methyltransferase [Fibrobacterota bacterium]